MIDDDLVRREVELEARIAGLKRSLEETREELDTLRSRMNAPRACARLGCDLKVGNLRCGLLLGHEGPGDAWSSQHDEAWRAWRKGVNEQRAALRAPAEEVLDDDLPSDRNVGGDRHVLGVRASARDRVRRRHRDRLDERIRGRTDQRKGGSMMAFQVRVTVSAWGDVEVEARDQLGGCWYPIASKHGDPYESDLSYNPVLPSGWTNLRGEIDHVTRLLSGILPPAEVFDDEGRPHR